MRPGALICELVFGNLPHSGVKTPEFTTNYYESSSCKTILFNFAFNNTNVRIYACLFKLCFSLENNEFIEWMLIKIVGVSEWYPNDDDDSGGIVGHHADIISLIMTDKINPL